MTLTRQIPEKVRRLVPMLGSPIDGESLGAARAIGRVLERDGLGFTDLAASIQTTPRPVVTYAPRPAAQSATRRYPAATVPEFNVYAFRRAYTPRQEAEHRHRVRFCQDRPWRLTSWERGFIENVARLYGNLSIRQGDHLARIVDRLEGEMRRA